MPFFCYQRSLPYALLLSLSLGELLFFYFTAVFWILLDGAWLQHHNGYTYNWIQGDFLSFFFLFFLGSVWV